MTVNNNSNFVGLCEQCNRDKGSRIVLPSWYTYLEEEQQEKLNRLMRYARSYVVSHTDDAEIIDYVTKL